MAPRSSTSQESEARLLLLIDAFTQSDLSVQGRVKLAKLDFLLRYPQFYKRALEAKGKTVKDDESFAEPNIEERMIRYRYGPWDPAYYGLLGSLVGRGLIQTLPEGRYTGLRTTEAGHLIALRLSETEAWNSTSEHANRLRVTFGRTPGTSLMKFIYEHFPEVSKSSWGDQL